MALPTVKEIMNMVEAYGSHRYLHDPEPACRQMFDYIEEAVRAIHPSELGRQGAGVTSELKARMARANGMKGGRPRRKTGKRTI